MKKYQYIVAAACVLVGAVGFSSMYMTNQAEQREAELARQQQLVQQQELADNSDEEEKEEEFANQSNIVADANLEPNVENQEEIIDTPFAEQDSANKKELEENQVAETEPVEADTPVGTITAEKLSFEPEKGLVWPIEGSVLLDYSMESTIFFPTLQQYQYNPAMVLSGNVNDKVYFIAKGKITKVETNEVTGCTVTQDIGDGYTAIYGQLKELNFEEGEMVESGQVVGYVSEPTKYYSVEGSNVYFQLLKDGVPIDPEEILP